VPRNASGGDTGSLDEKVNELDIVMKAEVVGENMRTNTIPSINSDDKNDQDDDNSSTNEGKNVDNNSLEVKETVDIIRKTETAQPELTTAQLTSELTTTTFGFTTESDIIMAHLDTTEIKIISTATVDKAEDIQGFHNISHITNDVSNNVRGAGKEELGDKSSSNELLSVLNIEDYTINTESSVTPTTSVLSSGDTETNEEAHKEDPTQTPI
jgi:hypothetical protein